MREAIFDNHFNTSNQDRSKEVEDLRETIKDGKTPTTDKVVPFGKLPGLKSKKSNIDFSLGFVLPGECYELFKERYSSLIKSQYLFKLFPAMLQQHQNWSFIP